MEEIFRADDIRYHNRKRVLSTVRLDGVTSRTEIAKRTGLSAATISAITSDFIEEGVLCLQTNPASKLDKASTKRGRPKVGLAINSSAATVCVVYFQLNAISACMLDLSGSTVSEFQVQIKTRTISSEDMKKALIDCIEQAQAQSGANALTRIAVGFQGVTDVDNERVLWTPICTQRDLPIAKWLEDYFGVQALVANDCDMISLALNRRNPQKFGENFATVLLANGVGMGLFLRGQTVNGTRSSGVEFGHMTYIPNGARCRCGNFGCIEAYAGDYAIKRHADGGSPTSVPVDILDDTLLTNVVEAADAGDKLAIEAIDTAGAAIGTGLASLYALVDSFPIVFAGPGAALYPHMRSSIHDALISAPGENSNIDLDVECYVQAEPLVHEGCAVSALLSYDDEIAARRRLPEAAE